jgi:diphthamide biosynthesis protein 7
MPAFDTIFPADSIEFCPHPKAQNIFVCGTYKLDEPLEPGPTNREAASPVDVTDEILDKAGSSLPQHRRGQCLVFDVQYEPTSVGEREL